MSAIFAFAAVALATTFTSCEKEEFNVNVTPVNAQAVISPIVLAVQNGVTTDVTGQATITPAELSFTGNPDLAAKNVEVTASYNDLSATVTVKVPALKAGQFAAMTPTIILQEETAETKIVVVQEDPTTVKSPWELPIDNYELFWYSLSPVKYIVKSGILVNEESKVINTTDLSEIALINAFFSTLKETYTEVEKETEKGKYSVYANSRTLFSLTYTVATTEYQVVKTVTRADAPLASIKTEDYSTSTLSVEENLDIPGHGHSHGHGHGHGGDLNAGGGIGDAD